MKRPAITDKMKLAVLRKSRVMVQCEGPCGDAVNLREIQYDHIQALIDNGAHCVENIRPICSVCHQYKSAFEHKRNAKGKRIRRKLAIHVAVMSGEFIRPPGKIKSNPTLPKGRTIQSHVNPWGKRT